MGIATRLVVRGHLLWGPLQYLCIFSLAWLSSVCFGWSAQKWQCCTHCAKCLSTPTAALCRLSPACDSFPSCSDQRHLLFTCTAAWGSSTTGDWTSIFSVPQQQQTCPKLYSSPFSKQCVPFSPSVASLCLKLFPLLLALSRTAEVNTEVKKVEKCLNGYPGVPHQHKWGNRFLYFKEGTFLFVHCMHLFSLFSFFHL